MDDTQVTPNEGQEAVEAQVEAPAQETGEEAAA